MSAARHLHVPAVAAAGHRATRSTPPTATRPSRRARPSTSTLTVSGAAGGGTARSSRPVTRDVELYGPGDIVGIDPRAIVRTEPRALDHQLRAQLPRRRSSSTTRTSRGATRRPRRTRPAAAAAVARARRAGRGRVHGRRRTSPDRPLPFIDGRATSRPFPPADELWAWAHVHVNRALAGARRRVVSTDMARGAAAAAGACSPRTPTSRYSRIVCPRRLAPNTAYHAFLVPAFESGRLAGLGTRTRRARRTRRPRPGRRRTARQPRRASRTTTAGTSAPATLGDFEYLVRLLEPQPVDTRVGRRDMDVQRPGSNLPGITDPDLGGVLQLGGALRVPRASLDADGARRGRALRELGRALPAPVPERAGRLRQPRRRLRRATADAANADTGLPRRRGRPRSADHAAALRPLARADARGCCRPRRRPRSTRRQLGARAQPRSALPRRGRLRHARRPGQPGDT